jgi:hypothetical protein
MRRLHLEHWWVSRSELRALDSLRASLAGSGITLVDDSARADASALLMSAQRVWAGVCGTGVRPLDLAAHVPPFDLESRIFPAFRAVDAPSHLSLYGIPLGAFRNNVVWVNRRAADAAGDMPADIDHWIDWLARTSRHVAKPLAVSREDWQVALLLELIVLAMHGCDFHRRVFGARAIDAIESAEMLEALRFLRELRRFVPPPLAAPAWHEVVADCRAGRRAAAVMGDWVHSELRLDAAGPGAARDSVCKATFPGTGAWFLYSVDYLVPIDRDGRPPDAPLLEMLTRVLLDPHTQTRFGLAKGSVSVVRDARGPSIDADEWKMVHLSLLCPDILIPSMGLLQGSPRSMRDVAATAVRFVLYGDASAEDSHASMVRGCRRAGRALELASDALSTVDGHHGSALRPAVGQSDAGALVAF